MEVYGKTFTGLGPKVYINIRRSYVYKCENNFTKEGYELTVIQFWVHMRSQISIHLIQLEVRAGFRHLFHSELSVVWDKRSWVANKIESKSYYSPLILHHSVRVLQKYPFEYIKNKRFVETVLLSTHETFMERSGSVLECLTRDRGATGSSLTGVTALWS